MKTKVKPCFLLLLLSAVISLLPAAQLIEDWVKEGNANGTFKIENELYELELAPGAGRLQVFSKAMQPGWDGMEASVSASFSGTAKIVLGCHYYTEGGKWMGQLLAPEQEIQAGEPVLKSFAFRLPSKGIVGIRPLINVKAGAVRFTDFRLELPKVIEKNAGLEEAPCLTGWQYDPVSKAVKIERSGDGDERSSRLKFQTIARQCIDFYRQKAGKVKENARVKILFQVSGRGSITAGCHLYNQKNIWTGKMEGEMLQVDSDKALSHEVNLILEKTENDEFPEQVRPLIKIGANSDLTVEAIQVMLYQPDPTPADFKSTLPQGFMRLDIGSADFPVRFFASENRLVIDRVSKPYDPRADKIVALRVRLIEESGNADLASGRVIEFQKGFIQDVSLNIPPLFRGDFRVVGEYLDADGQLILSGQGYSYIYCQDLSTGRYMVGGMLRNAHLKNWVSAFPVGQVLFHQKQYPFQEKDFSFPGQFPGFQLPRIQGQSVVLNNRTYIYGSDGFLQQLEARQSEPTVGAEVMPLLAAPLTLLIDGRAVKLSSTPLRQEGSALVWEQSGEFDGTRLTVANILESDGVQKLSFNLKPAAGFAPSRITLKIALREEQATLYQNITDVPYRRADRSKELLPEAGLGGQAGFTPTKFIRGQTVWESFGQERNRKGTFQPFLWLGNEDRGFCYFADTDQDWQLGSGDSALELERYTGTVALNINFVKRSERSPLGEMNWTLGLLGTPVKEPLEHWRGTIFPRWATLDKEAYAQMNNVRKLIMVSAGTPDLNEGSFSIIPQDWERAKDMYRKVRDPFNSTYLEYFCSDLLSFNTRELLTFFGEWCVSSAKANYQSKLTLGYQLKTYGVVAGAGIHQERKVPSFLNYRLWAIDKKLSEVGPFAFYEDNMHPRTFYDNMRNYGYVDEQGDVRTEFDLWSVRDYYRKLANIYKQHNSDNLTGAHASASLLIPAFTHCSFFVDGEQPGRYDNKDELDYIDHWKDLDYMRAISMGRAYGINSIFLSEMAFPGDDADGHHTRAWLALILPHDIAPWDGAIKNRAPVIAWHKLVNALDFYHDSPRLYPYWAKGQYKVFEHTHPELLVTLWKQKSRALIMLSNFGEQKPFTVKLDLEKLGLDGQQGLINYESKQQIAWDKSTFTLEVPRHDFQLLLLGD